MKGSFLQKNAKFFGKKAKLQIFRRSKRKKGKKYANRKGKSKNLSFFLKIYKL